MKQQIFVFTVFFVVVYSASLQRISKFWVDTDQNSEECVEKMKLLHNKLERIEEKLNSFFDRSIVEYMDVQNKFDTITNRFQTLLSINDTIKELIEAKISSIPNIEIVELLKHIERKHDKMYEGIHQLHKKWDKTNFKGMHDKIVEIPNLISNQCRNSVSNQSSQSECTGIQTAEQSGSIVEPECKSQEEKIPGIYELCSSTLQVSHEFTTCINVNSEIWTIIQQRTDMVEDGKHINFNRSWSDYASGFGDTKSEFWAGLEYMHQVTSKDENIILRVELTDFENNSVWEEYEKFMVSKEDDNYRLLLGNYSGTAYDSFSFHHGLPFSTFDRKNDEAPSCCPCAVTYGSGWWFKECFETNLNGVYQSSSSNNNEGYYKGIIWNGWLGNYSLRNARMMLRYA